jgi:toxin ParE1/3/4
LACEVSEAFAARFLAGFEADLRRIQLFPDSGAPRQQLAAGLRVTFHGRYAIYYVQRGRQIVVVRVLHGSRDVAALMGGEGFILDE